MGEVRCGHDGCDWHAEAEDRDAAERAVARHWHEEHRDETEGDD